MSWRGRCVSIGWMLAAIGCHGSSATDDGGVVLPAACRAAPGPALHAVTFDVHNDGARSVFLAVDYSCAFTAKITAASSSEDLLSHGGIVCPCTGDCPVGGPGCAPAGKELAPGGHEALTWQPSVPVLGTRAGNACLCGTRNLAPGRYHLSARAYASAPDAMAGDPALFTIDRDFEVPAPGDRVDVAVVPPGP